MVFRLKHYFSLMIAAYFVSIAVSCTNHSDTKLATNEIAKFHQLYNANKYAEIYETSSDEFKKQASETAFIIFISSVHNKLGDVTTSTFKSINVDIGTTGNALTVVQNTNFVNGKEVEKFVYRYEHMQVVLSGYWLTLSESCGDKGRHDNNSSF